MTIQSENVLALCGQVASAPVFSHQSHGERFFTFALKVQRLSKAYDIINILAREQDILAAKLKEEDFVRIDGELRSFNNKSGVGNRLVITGFAKELRQSEPCHVNELSLSGVICKEPIYRKTPLGREICDLMLAINRRYGRADYLPCIVWGKNAYACSELRTGCSVRITGRIQSREYIKVLDGVEQTRVTYEVSVSAIESLPG